MKKFILSVVNNEIYKEIDNNNKIFFYVRDIKDKRNANKFAKFAFINNRVQLLSSKYSINRTCDMLGDIERNIEVLLWGD